MHGFPFVHGAVVGSAVMGALIVSRYPRHPIGWLLSAVGTARRRLARHRGLRLLGLESDGPGAARSAAWRPGSRS